MLVQIPIDPWLILFVNEWNIDTWSRRYDAMAGEWETSAPESILYHAEHYREWGKYRTTQSTAFHSGTRERGEEENFPLSSRVFYFFLEEGEKKNPLFVYVCVRSCVPS